MGISMSYGIFSEGSESHFYDWGVMGTYTEDALLCKHITLNLLSLNLGDFFSALPSFTSGKPQSEYKRKGLWEKWLA